MQECHHAACDTKDHPALNETNYDFLAAITQVGGSPNREGSPFADRVRRVLSGNAGIFTLGFVGL